MPDAPPTQRDFDAMTRALNGLTAELRAMPDRIAETYVRKDVLESRLQLVDTKIGNQDKTLETHSSYFTWGARIVIGLVIVGIVGLLFASGGVHGT